MLTQRTKKLAVIPFDEAVQNAIDRVDEAEDAKEAKKKRGFFRKKAPVVKIESIHTDNPIPIRTNIVGIITSVILWGCLLFMVAFGVISLIERATSPPDESELIRQQNAAFQSEQREKQNETLKIQAYAGIFAKEYLTYQKGGTAQVSDYQSRINKYLANPVSKSGVSNFLNTATAVYTQAYDIQEYSSGQYNVFVMATVDYVTEAISINEENEKSEVITTEDTQNVYLKVPVKVLQDGNYIVQDYPLIIAEPDEIAKPEQQIFLGREVEPDTAKTIETLLNNFFRDYYQGTQTNIDYFLSPEADKSSFKGLAGQFTFDQIIQLTTYQDPQDGSRLLSIIELQIADGHGQKHMQKLYITLKYDNESKRYHIVEMDTKTQDLKYDFRTA